MPLATCSVSGTLLDSTGSAVVSADVKFNVVLPVSSTTIDALVVPKEVSTTTDSTGLFTLALLQSISGILTVQYPPNSKDSPRRYSYSIIVPASTVADIVDLITEP
jgi:hypothetical protein